MMGPNPISGIRRPMEGDPVSSAEQRRLMDAVRQVLDSQPGREFEGFTPGPMPQFAPIVKYDPTAGYTGYIGPGTVYGNTGDQVLGNVAVYHNLRNVGVSDFRGVADAVADQVNNSGGEALVADTTYWLYLAAYMVEAGIKADGTSILSGDGSAAQDYDGFAAVEIVDVDNDWEIIWHTAATKDDVTTGSDLDSLWRGSPGGAVTRYLGPIGRVDVGADGVWSGRSWIYGPLIVPSTPRGAAPPIGENNYDLDWTGGIESNFNNV